MDTSEQYIKMCEKAEEIQSHVFQKGDYYSFHRDRIVFRATPAELVGDYWKPTIWFEEVPINFGHFAVWLPCQDQLQKMVVGNKTPCQLSSDFYWWYTNQSWDYPNTFTSMEQLWLAFVMKEKYNKVWNGEKWQ